MGRAEEVETGHEALAGRLNMSAIFINKLVKWKRVICVAACCAVDFRLSYFKGQSFTQSFVSIVLALFPRVNFPLL